MKIGQKLRFIVSGDIAGRMDRVVVLNFGEKIAEGPSNVVMESDAVKKAYLGVEA